MSFDPRGTCTSSAEEQELEASFTSGIADRRGGLGAVAVGEDHGEK